MKEKDKKAVEKNPGVTKHVASVRRMAAEWVGTK
jgi:hypothetical protein